MPLEIQELLTITANAKWSVARNSSKDAANSIIFDLSFAEVAGVTGSDKLTSFLYERLAHLVGNEGFSPQQIDAVLCLHPQRMNDVPKRLAAVRTFAALPEAPALAAANKRISNILKKSDAVDAHVSEVLLLEPAEIALHKTMSDIVPKANAQFDAGD